jgi:signal transduction histidine kinase
MDLRQPLDPLPARIRSLERRLTHLLQTTSIALLVVDADKIVEASVGAVELLQWDSPDQLTGLPLPQLLPEEDAARVRSILAAAAPDSPALTRSLHLRCRDGAILTVSAHLARLDDSGEPALHIVISQTAESQRVVDAIRSLAAFAELNPNPVLEFTPEGSLGYFNEAAGEMARSMGRSHPRDILPPETSAIVRGCLATGQERLPVETSVNNRTLSWSFFPITRNNVVHCYVRDITERKQLEAQLRHSQKLESVGRLAAGVAHDFNNVLTVVQANAGVLRTDGGLSGAAAEHLQQIVRAAERGGKLTSQLLAFSKRNVLQPRRLDLNEVITNLSSLLHRTLGEDITYQFGYATDLPGVSADAGLLEQVILNLAVNARDAMPKGGQLVVNTSVVDVDQTYVDHHPGEARLGRFVCLSLADTGCGMDSVTLSRIFEPFFTTKEFGKGTGLGLATVYGIIKQHQGWISVRSQLGQGTQFKIYLPAVDKAAEQRMAVARRIQDLRGSETILVVEDEPPVRWILKDVLSKYGYHILEAASGVEALALWHQHHKEIALLLTDMVMPVGLTGQELAEKFTAQKPALKVIYISGYSLQAAGKDLAILDGPNFLQKPFDGAKLAATVRACLG